MDKRSFRAPPGRRLLAVGLGGALLLSAAILVRDILPSRRRLRDLRERERRILRENRELERETRRLELLEEALSTDPATVERELRRKVHVAKPGEKLILFDEDGP